MSRFGGYRRLRVHACCAHQRCERVDLQHVLGARVHVRRRRLNSCPKRKKRVRELSALRFHVCSRSSARCLPVVRVGASSGVFLCVCESEVQQAVSYRPYMCNCEGSSVCRAAAARTAPRSAPAYAAIPPRPRPRASPSSRRRLRPPQPHYHRRWPGYNTCRPLRATSAPTYEGPPARQRPHLHACPRVCALVPLVHTRFAHVLCSGCTTEAMPAHPISRRRRLPSSHRCMHIDA